ncbi:nucleotidyltransferase family protein [Massilia sp. G4R7]|uniref:Nucleotidyltransferase family protein n=1 Tax=Massilia phyllostachyos TaxID=2898585 RepID=A0ABS8QC86_9BURK|nr:nucleotidyltransferase family protein [Massilia phyllostachyos]
MKPALLVEVLREPGRTSGLAPREWELLLSQARAAGLHGALPYLLEDAGVQAPPGPRLHLDWLRTEAQRHRDSMRNEVRLIARALAQAGRGAELLLLKGAAYLMADLPLARGRMFGDIDIMVAKDALPATERALVLQGWAGTKLDEYDQRYYREWMHELPPLEHMQRGTTIDVHHAILPETAALRPDPARLRAAAVPIAWPDGMAGDCPLYTLAPHDMVLHSALHLFWDGEFDHGLRDLFDLHRLLAAFGDRPGFWEALPGRARELELALPLFYALRYTTRLLGTPVPPEVSAALAGAAPSPLRLACMDALFLRALMPMHPAPSGALDAPARFALYVRGNWLRMPPLLLARHLFHKAFLSPRKEERQEA